MKTNKMILSKFALLFVICLTILTTYLNGVELQRVRNYMCYEQVSNDVQGVEHVEIIKICNEKE